MQTPGWFEGSLTAKFQLVFPHLDERQRRLLMGAEARALGHGGIRVVARAAGAGEGTVARGLAELECGAAPSGRARRKGGGRKRVADLDPGLRRALLALVEPDSTGDPTSPLRWTTKSTRRLADELTRQGHKVSADTVGDLLREDGFSLRCNAKSLAGNRSPDRDEQFRYVNGLVGAHQAAGQPVVSVDAIKKELAGQHENPGGGWRPTRQPVPAGPGVFVAEHPGRPVPYGTGDLAGTRWVKVATDHDTAAFAVESIRQWWRAQGRTAYAGAGRLLVAADAGGFNAYLARPLKDGLAALAAETGLDITVCHLPPATSKWNTIEHRLFSHLTLHCGGRPLASHEVTVRSIATAATRTGLPVHPGANTVRYAAGVQFSAQEMAALSITPHDFHGDWNYTLHRAGSQHA